MKEIKSSIQKTIAIMMVLLLVTGTIGLAVTEKLSIKASALDTHETVRNSTEIANGVCGPELTWSLDNEGLLTISGSGEMYDYPLELDDSGEDVFGSYYTYDENGDFYYIDDSAWWQKDAGYIAVHDNLAPQESNVDDVQIRFTYEDKDWMIQLRKGQYNDNKIVGAEVSVYTAPRGTNNNVSGYLDNYKCADKEDWLDMQLDCYWDKEDNGIFKKIFAREYDKYWWATGFVEDPIARPDNELKLKTRITFKSSEMADLFVQAIRALGVKRAVASDSISDDSYFREGTDVWFLWTAISGNMTITETQYMPVVTTTVPETQPTTTRVETTSGEIVVIKPVTTRAPQPVHTTVATATTKAETTTKPVSSTTRVVVIPTKRTSSQSGIDVAKQRYSTTPKTQSVGYSQMPEWNDCAGMIKEVIINDGVTHIGAHAFEDCFSLKKITIPESVVSIGESAFDCCYYLDDVYYTGDIAGWCNIKFANPDASPRQEVSRLYMDGVLVEGDVVIPEGVTRIGKGAFRYIGNEVRSVTFPKSLKVIELSAFGSGSWDGESGFHWINYAGTEEEWNAITIEEDNSWVLNKTVNFDYVETGFFTGKCGDNLTWSLNKSTGELVISGTGDMYDYIDESAGWYIYGDYIKSIKIDEGVTSIGEFAFSYYSSYTGEITVSIASTVKTIKGGAFFGCGMTELVIPEGVTEIGNSAFAYCEYLKTVSIPYSVTHIGDSAFGACSFGKLVIPESVTSLGNSVFVNCDKLTDVYYKGTEEQWNKIEGLEKNEELNDKTIHFIQKKETGTDSVILECFDDSFEGSVTVEVSKKVIGKSDFTIGKDDGVLYSAIEKFDITIKKDGKEVQPSGKVTVKIKIPSNITITEQEIEQRIVKIKHYSKDKGTIDNIVGKNRLRLENGYIVFEVEHFSEFVLYVRSNSPFLRIRNNPVESTVNYGDILSLTAETANMSDGMQVVWYVNGEKKATGKTFKTTIKNDAEITAKIIGSDGNIITDENGGEVSDSQKVTVKDNLWLRIISFLKNLFGINRIIEQ